MTADERQAVEAMNSLRNIVDGYPMEREDIELIAIVGNYMQAATAVEREACAELCDDEFNRTAGFVDSEISRKIEKLAAAIRKRGEE